MHRIFPIEWAITHQNWSSGSKSISIDRYIDFQSINVSIFEKFSNIGMSHIILDQFLVLNRNPASFFRKLIWIDRFSIDQLIRFRKILEFRHVAYHSGSIFGPKYEFGILVFENRYGTTDILFSGCHLHCCKLQTPLFMYFANVGMYAKMENDAQKLTKAAAMCIFSANPTMPAWR